VLIQIETVKFALDWQAHLAADGGRKVISTFYRSAFMQDPEFTHHFVSLTEDAAKAKLSQLSRDFAKWRNRTGPLVSARNRRLRLY
ncbi:hypothetical protein FOMPIDRAFT_1079522, partial [Fomitopsis schrenkii]